MTDNKETEIIRGNRELDPFRRPGDPDTVRVAFVKNGCDFETQQVRILGRGLGDDSFAGELLTEPKQDFGRHKGDTVGFFLYRSPENGNVLIADMDPPPKLAREQLADGALLRTAIAAYHEEPTGEHWFDAAELLRDSIVFVPCDMKVSGEDERTILAMAGNDPQSLVGKDIIFQNEVRFSPVYLENGKERVLPVFSSAGKEAELQGPSLVPVAFTDVIETALGFEPALGAIVVVPFTVPFYLPVKILDIVGNMPSRLEN